MKKRYSGPQIVVKLREGDCLIGQGKSIPEVCKQVKTPQQTFYRWRDNARTGHFSFFPKYLAYQPRLNSA